MAQPVNFSNDVMCIMLGLRRPHIKKISFQKTESEKIALLNAKMKFKREKNENSRIEILKEILTSSIPNFGGLKIKSAEITKTFC